MGLIDQLNDDTPLRSPFGQIVVIAGLFLVAWLLVAAIPRLVSLLFTASVRRSAGADSHTVQAFLSQRETVVSLVRTSVRYAVYGIAIVLAIVVVAGARRVETIVGASFIAVIVAFSAQRFLQDVIAGLLMHFDGWFQIGDRVAVDPMKVEGTVEEVSPRSIALVTDSGRRVRVVNSAIQAVHVLTAGPHVIEVELYPS